jgi:hypothetical protein
VTSRTASCACGALTAVCVGEPIRVSVCHCLECQKRTGSAFGVQARFAADQVTISGPVRHWVRVGDSGQPTTFDICPTCGSTVAWQNASAPDVMAVAVGAFADPAFPAPIRSIYEDRAHPWVELTGILERD